MFPSVELLCFIGREGYNCFSHAYLVSIQSRTNRFLHSVSVAVTICGTRFEVSDSKRRVLGNYCIMRISYGF